MSSQGMQDHFGAKSANWLADRLIMSNGKKVDPFETCGLVVLNDSVCRPVPITCVLL